MKSGYKKLIATVLFLGALSFLIGGFLGLRAKNKELNEKEDFSSFEQSSFIKSEIKTSNGNFVKEKKEEFIKEKKDFVVIDLKEMELSLHEEGNLKENYNVLSKGKEGSWWETPTGLYHVLSKEVNHYSSIGDVWMPWSIKFYGNFYVHGWPYYPGGKPVRESFSGGCIRLSDDVAKSVFEFVEKGTPILIHEVEDNEKLKTLAGNSQGVPEITAESAFVADLKTGEVVLNKNAGVVQPIASLAKLMSGVTASEVIYLEQQVRINERMLRDAVQSYPFEVGSYYKVFDLLYPFLQQSSNGAGRAIAAAIGEDEFVRHMNKKADSLGMNETNFVDPNGISSENTSTLKDIFKLAKYTLEKRKFLYDITKGEDYYVFGPISFANIDTYNEFHDNSQLVGAKNGQTEAAGETYASVWKLNKDGQTRYIFIGVLGSENRRKDVERILEWLKGNFDL